MESQTAIVLFNLGGPDDLASVEPFLVNLFRDREIIQLPGGAILQPLMARLIAKMRGPSVRENTAGLAAARRNCASRATRRTRSKLV